MRGTGRSQRRRHGPGICKANGNGGRDGAAAELFPSRERHSRVQGDGLPCPAARSAREQKCCLRAAAPSRAPRLFVLGAPRSGGGGRSPTANASGPASCRPRAMQRPRLVPHLDELPASSQRMPDRPPGHRGRAAPRRANGLPVASLPNAPGQGRGDSADPSGSNNGPCL